MNDIDILKPYIAICDLHQNRIEIALDHISPLLSLNIKKLNILSDKALNFLALLTSRFAKPQNTTGKKVFPFILKELQEYDPSQSFLIQSHKSEKLQIIDDANLWNQFRHIRNIFPYEYPENPASIAKWIE